MANEEKSLVKSAPIINATKLCVTHFPILDIMLDCLSVSSNIWKQMDEWPS